MANRKSRIDGKKVEFAKFESVMAKIDYRAAVAREEYKKRNEQKRSKSVGRGRARSFK